MPELELKVGSRRYGGWKQMRVQRGLRRFADTFDLNLTERWTRENQRRPIKEDDPCQILIDGELVITGYVDDVNSDYDANTHNVNVTGRSRLGDLVDCGASHKQWSVPVKLERLAADLCKPFGINVVAEVGTGEPLQKPEIELGETPYEFLLRMASYRGVLLTSNKQGDLVITRAGKARTGTALVLGENILRAGARKSKRERFHTYNVIGQHGGYSDESFGEDVAHITGLSIDKAMRQGRTTYIDHDNLTRHDAKCLAEYERNVRYGESQAITYTVNGWRHKDGLWLPNRMVNVVDPYNEINEERLIAHVTYIMGDEGELCELEVMPREALDTVALPEPQDEEVLF